MFEVQRINVKRTHDVIVVLEPHKPITTFIIGYYIRLVLANKPRSSLVLLWSNFLIEKLSL